MDAAPESLKIARRLLGTVNLSKCYTTVRKLPSSEVSHLLSNFSHFCNKSLFEEKSMVKSILKTNLDVVLPLVKSGYAY